MEQKVLLITPPFTQLNTPYTATAYIKGFLNSQNINSCQVDLGIETILSLFTKKNLAALFQLTLSNEKEYSQNIHRIHNLRKNYIACIEPVISFLQNQDPTLAYLICGRNFLPEASKFKHLEDLEWAFGTMGIRDQARHLATLFLEDIADYIIEVIDPHFGFSRYAESLGLSANSFDPINDVLLEPDSFITKLMLEILHKKVEGYNPTMICFSVPFPGNLFAALKCGQYLKKKFPNIKIALGGGYANTEMRNISDARVFNYIDFICLDDGEAPLLSLLNYLAGNIDHHLLKRTFMCVEGEIAYLNGSLLSDVKQDQLGTPDYDGLLVKHYLSVIQMTNPMHRLWNDGRWNKLTMAHGCYWGKCTFCDISLDYIKNYEASSAITIVDRMETIIAQTGERGFHFVDEAAPPALMKSVALEIIKRELVVNWWTNIRFEKSFHFDLCRLLAASGCIAVSGGLEVASDRLLKLIAKGVTIEQVSVVNDNFNRAGIMVHAYLMYGFPTQTDQETIDSLEVVRQMFETGILQSAFWHRFAATAHSPVGMYPDQFNIKLKQTEMGSFANNDLIHEDPQGCNHSLYTEGLNKSLYNYMHGVCLDHPLKNWFEHKSPKTSLSPTLIESYLDRSKPKLIKDSDFLIWLGNEVHYDKGSSFLNFTLKQKTVEFYCKESLGFWLAKMLNALTPMNEKLTKYHEFKEEYLKEEFHSYESFWSSDLMTQIRSIGLISV